MLGDELKKVLQAAGAELIGYADMTGIENCDYPIGVAVGVPLSPVVVVGITDGPTKAYHQEYHRLNSLLDEIVTAGTLFLQKCGYQAFAQTVEHAKWDKDWCTAVPHKTVSTRAGLGWIGRSCLLVTAQFGSALRISSLLTDAPLEPLGTPINDSRCHVCDECRKYCPAQSIYGTDWHAGLSREKIFDRFSCKDKQLELMQRRTGINQGLCGKCIVVCPYTRRYVREAGKDLEF